MILVWRELVTYGIDQSPAIRGVLPLFANCREEVFS
jgi:hypothetical protein